MDLNPSQQAAVEHRDGPLLVVAGPGSGKTRVLTHRIAHLIASGVPAGSILAITFTNKASGEMLERTLRLLDRQSEGEDLPVISTFHAYCARLLRRHIYRLEPYQVNFTIYDTADQKSVIEEALAQLELDRSSYPSAALLGRVSSWKNEMVSPDDAFDECRTQKQRDQARVYAIYQRLLSERNAVDFDDLLLLALRLLREAPNVLDRERAERRYLMVDEFQDTNRPQYLIARLLAEEHRNLCITGDPDQSIYSWRGASPFNFQSFDEDFPERQVVLLNQNYRSTPQIIGVAGRLTGTMLGKRELFTHNPAGESVEIFRHSDERREARRVVEEIVYWQGEDTPLREIAVLYRINAQSRSLEEALVRGEVPYTIVGGVAFYQRKEVKDVLAYLRAAAYTRDELALRRIINVPNRGIGPVSVERLDECARRHQLPLGELLEQPELWERITARARAALESLRGILGRLRELRSQPLSHQVRAAIDESDYLAFLERTDAEGWRDRVENLHELENAAAEMEEFLGGWQMRATSAAHDPLTHFLERVSLVSDIDNWESRSDRVALMTLHSAKGLEFDRVVITGVEDQFIPHSRSESLDDMDEERRLLYVGITRARQSVRLYHCEYRRRFNRMEPRLPSPFLRDLDGEGVIHREQEPAEMHRGWGNWEKRAGNATAEAWGAEGPEPADSDDDELSPGVILDHDHYGRGTVTRCSGRGDSRRVTVDFIEHGEKSFVVGYAAFRVVGRDERRSKRGLGNTPGGDWEVPW